MLMGFVTEWSVEMILSNNAGRETALNFSNKITTATSEEFCHYGALYKCPILFTLLCLN